MKGQTDFNLIFAFFYNNFYFSENSTALLYVYTYMYISLKWWLSLLSKNSSKEITGFWFGSCSRREKREKESEKLFKILENELLCWKWFNITQQKPYITAGMTIRDCHTDCHTRQKKEKKQIKINNWYDNLIVIPIVIPVQNKTILFWY